MGTVLPDSAAPPSQTPPEGHIHTAAASVGHDAHIVPDPTSTAAPTDNAETLRPVPVGHDAHIVPKTPDHRPPPSHAPTSRDRP